MADGREESLPQTRQRYAWTEIFRCFLIALDPRKLAVAALGILAVSFGWYILSWIFLRSTPDKTSPEYSKIDLLQREFKGYKHPDGKEYSEDDLLNEGNKKYIRDVAQWNQLNALAGPGGRLSTMPWYEYRGPNPYTLVTTLLSGSAIERQEIAGKFFSSTLPTLFEPLVKLLIPIAKVFDKDISPMTRFYLLLCIFWSLLCWAYFAGILTRIAAVQLSGKDRIGLMQAVHFVTKRYLSYLLSPVVPLAAIAFATIMLALLGLPTLIPFVADVAYIILIPLGLLGGFVMAMLLIGLLGYPLMYTTLSVEGSDTFDALSRAYNYVMQAPWQYLWYCLVAIFYGAAVTLVVVFIASLSVYLGKWALSQTPFNESANQRPEYLFIHAPESFGWKQLLLHGSPIEKVEVPASDGRKYVLENRFPADAKRYEDSLAWYNIGASYVATFWLIVLFMIMLGFSYSFFWSAMTMIYLLMRRHVDEVDLDEIYLEEDEGDLPPVPSLPTSPPPSPVNGQTSLPMVPPPATVPFTPPAASPPPTPSAEDKT